MRIVLQHIESTLFLQSPGFWTRDLAEALDFGNSQRAIKFVRQHRLTGMQVLVAFINKAYVETVALRIDPSQAVLQAGGPSRLNGDGVSTPLAAGRISDGMSPS